MSQSPVSLRRSISNGLVQDSKSPPSTSSNSPKESPLLPKRRNPSITSDMAATPPVPSLSRQSSKQSLSRLQSSAVGGPKQENVHVAVRLRPLSDSELSANQSNIWDVAPGQMGRVLMNKAWQERLKKTTGVTDFQFDHVHFGSDNEEIYKDGVSKLVWSAMEGYSGTVFAYGQTSSGKTYTMMGTSQNRGIIPRAIDDLFHYITANADREFLLRVSYLEIYNEMIRDLLSPENNDLKIHEDKQRGVYVSPLREEIVTSPEQVIQVIQRGEANRHVSTTDYNEHSSRSHCLFQVVIESREKSGSSQLDTTPTGSHVSRFRSGAQGVRLSTLNLIDLAGSEKAATSADRRREGSYINRSLLTLGTVIARLTDNQGGHVPYRDSKLTRILQPSLQGTARVFVVCTVSPAMNNFEETTNTMKFAQRIKKVVTRATTMEVMDDKALLQQYRNEINELRSKLTNMTERDTESSQLAAEKQRLEEELHQQQLVRTALKERIDHLTKLILTSSSFNTQAIINTWQPAGTEADPKPLVAKTESTSQLSLNQPTDELSNNSMELNKQISENNALQQSLEAKDRQIQLLLEEIKMLRSIHHIGGSGTPLDMVTDDAARKRIEELEQRDLAQSAEIEALRQELSRARNSTSPALVDLKNASFSSNNEEDPDRTLVLEHQVDQLKEKLEELETELRVKERTVLSLTAELTQYKNVPAPLGAIEVRARSQSATLYSNFTDHVAEQKTEAPAFSNGTLPQDASKKTANAQLLSSLMPDANDTRPSSADKSLSASSSAERLIKDMERSLDLERTMLLDADSPSSSSGKAANATDTDLTFTKVERSISNLMQSYLPTRSGTGSLTNLSQQRSPAMSSRDRLASGTEELQRYLRKLEKGSGDLSP